jgi:hypothetical protein
VLKNIKSFTELKIIDAIIKNPKESRKDCLPSGEAGMLSILKKTVRQRKPTITISSGNMKIILYYWKIIVCWNKE